MASSNYAVSTSNSFVSLSQDGDFQTVKRKRNNTDNMDSEQSGEHLKYFMNRSADQKNEYDLR